MNIKKRAEKIMRKIHKFDEQIYDLDAKHDFEFYSIFLPSTAIPYSIELRRRGEESAIGKLKIDYEDAIYTTSFVVELESEFARLQKENAPEGQVEELQKIREIFGV